VKGLMFNLLESLASKSGCSDEAWELVAEFAGWDSVVELPEPRGRRHRGDVLPPHAFEIPTEAMLNCLMRDNPEGDEFGPDLIDMSENADWIGVEPLTDAVPSFYDAMPRSLARLGDRSFPDSGTAESNRTLDRDIDHEASNEDRELEWDEDGLLLGALAWRAR
jgi:hypothetical protein